ncbi:MAG: murein biosynthesis integral membrane protein MurJ [Gemmatimonadaceae bacterium]
MTHTAPDGDGPPAFGSEEKRRGGGTGAVLVAAGILASRLAGFVRQRVFAHYFGVTDAADAFSVAFRIPNLLQNLLGEGVLSGSFIPVYAGLRAEGEDKERRDVASAVLWLLVFASAVVVLAGILLAPWLVDILSPGFKGAKRDLTITLVRILYPGAGLLVWSAWCLGVLNSHGRFFLSYAAPVVWNAAMIVALVVNGPGREVTSLAVLLAWASVVGSALVVALQLPSVLRLLRGVRATLGQASPHVRTVRRNFVPAVIGRGVVQLSAYVDIAIASLIASGAAAILGYAQLLYLLPVSLFGMAVTAAELPAMSSGRGTTDEIALHVRKRLVAGLDRIAFFVVPSAVAFLAFGDALATILYRGGRFGAAESAWVWRTLGGAAIGLVAATAGRLYASAFYAMKDARTPVRFALARVALSTAIAVLLALLLPRVLDLDPLWGVAGLTVASSVGSITEFLLLRRALARRVGTAPFDAGRRSRLWLAALGAAGVASLLRLGLGVDRMTLLGATAIVLVFGSVYLLVTWRLGFTEVASLTTRLTRLRRRRAN